MEHCRRVDVDQVPVLVRFHGEPTDADVNAVRQLVRAARRKYLAEHPEARPAVLGEPSRHGRTLDSVWCCEGRGYGPDGRCLCECHAPAAAESEPAAETAQ